VNWTSAANWSTNFLPGPEDDVTISAAANPIVIGTGIQSINQLTCDRPLTVSGASTTLQVATTATLKQTLTLAGGRLAGGTYIDAGGGSITSSAGGTLNGVTLAIDMSYTNVSVTVLNDLTLLDGATVTLNQTGASGAFLDFQGSGNQTLRGSGSVVFNGNGSSPNCFLRPVTDGGTLVIGSGITVRTGTQGGFVGSSNLGLVNLGTINSQTKGKILTVQGASLINNGAMQSSGGGILQVTATTGTNNGAITFATGGIVRFAGALTHTVGSVFQGSGTLAFIGGTQVFDGTIAGNVDVTISGGNLTWSADANVKPASLTLTGGTNTLEAGARVTVPTTTITGGTMIIGAPPFLRGSLATDRAASLTSADAVDADAADAAAAAEVITSYVTEDFEMVAGTVQVNGGGGVLEIITGLQFSGVASPSIILVSDAVAAGRLVLNANAISDCTGGVASIVSSGNAALPGTVELGGVQRTFTVASAASDLVLGARLTEGGVRKDGAGALRLTGANDYELATTVAAGRLEVHDGALPPAPVNLTGGNLSLRSNAALALFGHDIVASSAAIDVDRSSGAGPVGTFRLGTLTIGASRLTVRGINGGALEFTGAVTLTGGSAANSGASVIENFIPVLFGNAIGGTGKLTKDTGTAALTFGGAAANTYPGATRVNAGTLKLNKPAGVTAVVGRIEAFTGGQVEWMNHDQVADTATLSVNSVGGALTRIDLKAFHDRVASLELTAGTIATDAAGGLLRVDGGITSYPNTSTAHISGNLELPAGMHVVHATNIPKAPAPPNPVAGTAVDDLIISAGISGGGGITKSGSQRVVLVGTNFQATPLSFAEGTLAFGGADGVVTVGPMEFVGGSLDVGSNDLLIDYTGDSPLGGWNGSAYTGVTGLIESGRTPSGTWDGPGIGTSMEQAAVQGVTGLAVAEASAVLFISGSETALWEGRTVDATTVIVKYTYTGDLNLDGLIDGADYGIIDNYVQFPGTDGYVNGDFNYDGLIDGADYGLIDNAIQLQGLPL
jgi:autotransporter-associated beta strand protein